MKAILFAFLIPFIFCKDLFEPLPPDTPVINVDCKKEYFDDLFEIKYYSSLERSAMIDNLDVQFVFEKCDIPQIAFSLEWNFLWSTYVVYRNESTNDNLFNGLLSMKHNFTTNKAWPEQFGSMRLYDIENIVLRFKTEKGTLLNHQCHWFTQFKRQPNFYKIIHVSEGDTVVLTCSFPHATRASNVSWYYNLERVRHQSEKFSYTWNNVSKTSVATLKNITKEFFEVLCDAIFDNENFLYLRQGEWGFRFTPLTNAPIFENIHLLRMKKRLHWNDLIEHLAICAAFWFLVFLIATSKLCSFFLKDKVIRHYKIHYSSKKDQCNVFKEEL